MSRFVTGERVEELGGFGQGEREDQPVWLGGRKRFLGMRSGEDHKTEVTINAEGRAVTRNL